MRTIPLQWTDPKVPARPQPLVFMLLYNHRPLSAGEACDLLLINKHGQGDDGLSFMITLNYKELPPSRLALEALLLALQEQAAVL